MKAVSPFVVASFFVAAATFTATSASANAIENACLSSGSGSRALCACIAGVADATLNGRQIREGARWFDDPQRAQDTRQSDRASDEAMWQAWRTFSSAAEQRCSG